MTQGCFSAGGSGDPPINLAQLSWNQNSGDTLSPSPYGDGTSQTPASGPTFQILPQTMQPEVGLVSLQVNLQQSILEFVDCDVWVGGSEIYIKTGDGLFSVYTRSFWENFLKFKNSRIAIESVCVSPGCFLFDQAQASIFSLNGIGPDGNTFSYLKNGVTFRIEHDPSYQHLRDFYLQPVQLTPLPAAVPTPIKRDEERDETHGPRRCIEV